MLKLLLIIYFIWGVSFNCADCCLYCYKRWKGIKFVITEEEGYIPVRARILKSIITTIINILLLIIVITL